MTDESERYYRPGFAAEADRWIDRVKTYLGQRRAADWGFFAAGVLLGALFF
jgi:hypothetical protein